MNYRLYKKAWEYGGGVDAPGIVGLNQMSMGIKPEIRETLSTSETNPNAWGADTEKFTAFKEGLNDGFRTTMRGAADAGYDIASLGNRLIGLGTNTAGNVYADLTHAGSRLAHAVGAHNFGNNMANYSNRVQQVNQAFQDKLDRDYIALDEARQNARDYWEKGMHTNVYTNPSLQPARASRYIWPMIAGAKIPFGNSSARSVASNTVGRLWSPFRAGGALEQGVNWAGRQALNVGKAGVKGVVQKVAPQAMPAMQRLSQAVAPAARTTAQVLSKPGVQTARRAIGWGAANTHAADRVFNFTTPSAGDSDSVSMLKTFGRSALPYIGGVLNPAAFGNAIARTEYVLPKATSDAIVTAASNMPEEPTGRGWFTRAGDYVTQNMLPAFKEWWQEPMDVTKLKDAGKWAYGKAWDWAKENQYPEKAKQSVKEWFQGTPHGETTLAKDVQEKIDSNWATRFLYGQHADSSKAAVSGWMRPLMNPQARAQRGFPAQLLRAGNIMLQSPTINRNAIGERGSQAIETAKSAVPKVVDWYNKATSAKGDFKDWARKHRRELLALQATKPILMALLAKHGVSPQDIGLNPDADVDALMPDMLGQVATIY